MRHDIAAKLSARGFVPLLPQTSDDFEEQGARLRELGPAAGCDIHAALDHVNVRYNPVQILLVSLAL